jgi:exonuclease SbcD
MHFADVHFGVETYGKYNPETGLNTRLEDFTKALNDAVDLAIEADVDLAVFAGDAYKARDPNQTHQRAFAGCLKRLTDRQTPVVMLVGNHDIPNTRGRAHALEIYGLLGGAEARDGITQGVTLLSSPRLATITTRKGDVLVAGMPYLTRSRVLAQEDARSKTVEDVAHLIRNRYVEYIADLAREAAAQPEYIAILTGHFTIDDARVGVQNFLMNPNEPKVALSDIALKAFDYVAMGHVHKMQNMHRDQQPPVVYPGSIDRIDFGERLEAKGFVIADIVKGHANWKHVGVKTRAFLSLDIDASESEDPTRFIVDEIARHPIQGSVLRLIYKVSPDRASLVRLEEIRKALAPAHIVVALTREMPASEALIRSKVLTEALTPERALATYVDMQPRLVAQKEDLLRAARPLFDLLEQEESLR